jgi:hypothetical protein
MNGERQVDNGRQRAAEEALRRVARESHGVADSGLGGVVDSTRRHFGAADVDPADPIEVWGTRIGRGLALIAIGLLLWHLIATYG